MTERIVLPPEAPRGAKMDTGKGWRLVTKTHRRAFKAALITIFRSNGQRYAVFRIV